MAFSTKRLTRRALSLWLTLLLAGCASRTSPHGREDSGWLTLTLSPERSQPGCPIVVRLHVRPGGPDIVRAELRWRVTHGRSVRNGVLPLLLTPVARDGASLKAEIAFKPLGAGTYRIEARIEEASGRMSIVKSRHDVVHVWPFAAPPACDADPSAPNETSAP